MPDSPPSTHTRPLIIKPYGFPDTISQPAVVSAVDPGLDSMPRRLPKARFSSEDLERLVRFAAEEEPWAKPHGGRANAWKKILDRLQSEGRFQGSCTTTLQNKVNALVAWQEVHSVSSSGKRHLLIDIFH